MLNSKMCHKKVSSEERFPLKRGFPVFIVYFVDLSFPNPCTMSFSICLAFMFLSL